MGVSDIISKSVEIIVGSLGGIIDNRYVFINKLNNEMKRNYIMRDNLNNYIMNER